ncbi:MAG TPA: hypothetical protein PKK33_07345 [Candidatus Cloacimonadota bacterium]|nr:hypothetical protein [Candidatus Cloacimonadota bacterium]
MKLDRKANLVVCIAFSAILVLWLFLEILTGNMESYVTLTPRLTSLSPCTNVGNTLVKKDHFSKDDDVFLCVSVDSSNGKVDSQVDVLVFKDKIRMDTQYYYYVEYHHLTNNTTEIPLRTDFDPGYYVYYIRSGKLRIGSGSFTIYKPK